MTAGRRFVLDVTGVDSNDTSRTIALHLDGAITNVPPIADAGGDRTVACATAAGTPVTLDGGASHDPDLGDAIVDYQWFTSGGEPRGNTAAVTVNAPPGESRYVVHVYDMNHGAGSALVRVSVGTPCPVD